MCGIAGVWHAVRATAVAAAQAMNRAQARRGPDDEGLEAFDLPGGCLALGHRRLAILDLSSAGHQPMTHPQTGDWVVFNGEIYNFPELRRELAAHGSVFRSRCDTEVILHAFARWGCDCFERLHGMFALAIWDARQARLVLARDPLGIKPLYYARTTDGFLFASELQALAASELLDSTLDRRAIAGLLAYGAVPQPLTMYRQAKALEPGTWQAWALRPNGPDQAARRRFWSFPAPTAPLSSTLQLHEQLRQAFQSHLLSDVPVGLFLSSGLDSSALAVLCQETAGQDVRAFTIGLPSDEGMDESAVAEATARQLGLRYERILVPDDEVLASARQFLERIDQPSIDGLNTYLIAGAVRQRGIVVALSGLGGDELFGGYPSFRDVPRMLFWSRLLGGLPRSVAATLVGWAARDTVRRQKALEILDTPRTLRSMYFRRRRLLSDAEMTALGFRPTDLDLNEDYLPPECQPDQDLPAADAAAAVSVLESRFYMGNMLLRDSDVCGMAHGLEIRVPLLDKGVLNTVLATPGQQRVSPRGPNKGLLIQALGNHMPSHLLNLPKRGFTLPYGRWMLGPLHELFTDALSACENAGVASSGIRQVWQAFEQQPSSPSWSRAWILGILGRWIIRSKERQEMVASYPNDSSIKVCSRNATS